MHISKNGGAARGRYVCSTDHHDNYIDCKVTETLDVITVTVFVTVTKTEFVTMTVILISEIGRASCRERV